MALSNQRLQYLLSQQPEFQARVSVAMIVVALQVLAEQGIGASHAARANYARTVVLNPGAVAQGTAILMAQSTNVRGTITMEDEGPRTSVTDAALESQVSSLWNALAGVDTGT